MQPIFIAGPCVIESAEVLDSVAQKLVEINHNLGVDIIFKSSFDKANRTSVRSFRGPGLEKGLQMLADVKMKYGLRILPTYTSRIRQQRLARWLMLFRYLHSSAVRQIYSRQLHARGAL